MAYRDFKNRFTKKRISYIYVFYWLMLAYMVAALSFWFISLSGQNAEITRLKTEQLQQDHPAYQKQLEKIQADERSKTFQYVGEGSTFLILIIASAIFVFRMLRAQLKLLRQQKDFMMAVTHELKTPIAVTKLNLETMLKRQLQPAQQEKLLNSTLAETDRLNALSSNMLLLNEMGTAYTIANEDIDVNDLLDECVSEHRSRFPLRKFVVHTEPDIHIYGDRMLIKLAINNLLDNAVKYSPRESVITIRSCIKDLTTYIEISDEGPGVPEEEVKKIFQKYYRGTGRQAKGTGLGLYVTTQIVRQSRGKLDYRPNQPTGSRFTISFAG